MITKIFSIRFLCECGSYINTDQIRIECIECHRIYKLMEIV